MKTASEWVDAVDGSIEYNTWRYDRDALEKLIGVIQLDANRLTDSDLLDLKVFRPQVEKLMNDPRCPECGFTLKCNSRDAHFIHAASPIDARRALEVIDKILKEAK